MKKATVSVLSTVIGGVLGAVLGARGVLKATGSETSKAKELAGKHFALFQMMNQWVLVKQEGKNLSSFFEQNGYKKIAIYGMSYAGKTLLEELKDSKISIAYGIDRNAEGIYADIEVFSMEEELESVDAVVVTAITYFDEIENELKKKVACPILSLEDILYEV